MNEQAAKPKRKRRWFRFSLKTFLVLVTLFCVLMAFLGALVYRVNKQREAVQWVKEHGGEIYYDYQWELSEGVIDDPDPPGPDWLRDLIGIDYFADVVFVDFDDTEIEDIESLRELTQLQILNLKGTQVSDLTPFMGMKYVTIVLDDGHEMTIPEELKDRVLYWPSR